MRKKDNPTEGLVNVIEWMCDYYARRTNKKIDTALVALPNKYRDVFTQTATYCIENNVGNISFAKKILD